MSPLLYVAPIATSCTRTHAPPLTPSPSPFPAPAPFLCTEVIGLTITAEWYSAGFEQLVDDARFQARTRPHTFVDQWADAKHEAWSEPITSPCTQSSERPDRVVLFAANWQLPDQAAWTTTLEAFVATARQRYPHLRDLELFTVLRGPGNQTCGNDKAAVAPMIDAAIAAVTHAHPELVHAAPKLEAPSCVVFKQGGPHFTPEGAPQVAQQLAAALR